MECTLIEGPSKYASIGTYMDDTREPKPFQIAKYITEVAEPSSTNVCLMVFFKHSTWTSKATW